MLFDVRLLPHMIKAWKDNREPLYSLIATMAGALVVANVATGFRQLGLSPWSPGASGSSPPLSG